MSSDISLPDTRTWPSRPLVMGIVNVTPDSFSDGGQHARWDQAVQHALNLVAEGADLLDIGGESTRPGAAPVSLDEELDRVLPVVRVLSGEVSVPLSIDTRKPAVADQALASGASWVNDVGGLGDPEMIATVARHGAGACIVHMRGEPGTMQDAPQYGDVLAEVGDFLSGRARLAREAGIPADRLWLDPGIGFGKTLEHNLLLMAGLDRFVGLGYPVLLGASRKRFIGELSGNGNGVDERLPGSLAAAACALRAPRAIVRVHDVAATRQFFEVTLRLRRARAEILRS